MSATVSIPAARPWLPQLLSGQPHQVVGPTDKPYLKRWYLWPQNRWCNGYLHAFLRSDDDQEMHDHPWDFLTLILKGRYTEITPTTMVVRRAGAIAYRRATWRHRVELHTDRRDWTWQIFSDGRPTERPCYTLVITGPRRRPWGFWCANGQFIPWQQFGPGSCGASATGEAKS